MEENILEVIQVEAENNLGFNQPLAQVSLSVDSMSVTEDSGENLIYNFTRDGDTSNSLLVNFTVSGSATLDTDYNQTGAEEFDTTKGKVTIAAGQTTATVTITPIADNEIESDETVKLTLAEGNYIIDDDSQMSPDAKMSSQTDENGMVMGVISNDDVNLNVDWAKNIGGNKSLTIDNEENIYVAGSFGGKVTVGNKTIISKDNSDIFVAKFDKDGNVSWAEGFAGKDYERANDIALDDDGNTYITGSFRDEITFGDITLDGNGTDLFATKFDSKGNVVWAKNFGASDFDYGYGIDVDNNGNTYITGRFANQVLFDNIALNGGEFGDAFVAKLNSEGSVIWAKNFGTSSFENRGEEIVVDDEGNSYLFMTEGEGDNRISVAKLDNNGSTIWKQNLNGSRAKDIAVDDEGNSYIAGAFQDTATFGNTTLESDNRDLFVAKLDSKGDVLWAKDFNLTADGEVDDITIDNEGNSYVSGIYYTSKTSVGEFTLYGERGGNAFIAKFDSNGEMEWAQNVGGANSERIYDIAEHDNKIYLAGGFNREAIFSDTVITAKENVTNGFIVKLAESKPESEIEKPEVSLSVDSNKITEGNNNQITYTFTRTGELNTALTIDFTAAGTATFNEDYRLTGAEEFDGSEGKVTFEAEEATATVSLNITDDNIVEQDETVALSLAMGSNYTVSMTDVAANTITISSDDKEVIVDEKPEIPIDNNNDNQDDEKEEIEIPIGNENNDDDDNDDETEFTLASQTKQTFKLKSNSTTGKSPIKFSFKSKSIDELKEIAVVTVDDDEGNIDGISPNSEGYIEAALERSQSIFSLLGNTPQGFENIDIEKVLEFSSETRFRFLSVKGGTLQGVKKGKIKKSQVTVSSTDLLQISELEKNSFDLDFEGVKIKMKFDAKAKKAVGSGLQDEIEVLDFRDITGTRTVEFSVNREAAFDNVIGFYKVTSKNGGIDTDGDGTADVLVGNENYAQIAVQNRIASIDLNVENQFPKTLTRTLEAGAIIVPFLIVNGNTEAFDDIFFPYIGANSDGVDHVMMLGDNTFGFEDLKGGGDRDYNDFLVKVDVMNMNVDAMSVST